MASLEKKKKRQTKITKQKPSLPNDLWVTCFARISRLHYPTLSLVSKSFRSLLTSPELYKTRSLLNRTESCLYVCLNYPNDPNPHWFTLCLKPNSGKYVLAKVPIRHSPPAHWSGLVAVGSDIYNIGGCTEDSPSSSVSYLDCRSHTWKMAPDMWMERNYPAANVVDGKIYVAGGCKDCDSSNWMEVFDPKMQSWELVSCPMKERCGCDIDISAGLSGRVYTLRESNATSGKCKGMAYETKNNTWINAVWNMDIDSYTVIENILYYYSSGEVKWNDVKKGGGGRLGGLNGLPTFGNNAHVELADFGGKLAILWDRYAPSSGGKEKMIWCAVIGLEINNNDGEMWGKV